MKFPALFSSVLMASAFTLVALPAQAQDFPSHLKKCKKNATHFERDEGQFRVPDQNGGTGIVHLVSQNYTCEHKTEPWTEWPKFYGLKDASGNLIIPYRYLALMPYSTTGALVQVRDKYRTYTVGRGESREQYDFHKATFVTPPMQCYTRRDDAVSTPMGQSWANRANPVGPSDVTLFSPAGQPRVLRNMGGEGLVPGVQRIGDIFRARWRDEGGVVRTGLLDLNGNRVSPVLAATHDWSTVLPPGADRTGRPNCAGELSHDLLLEGPSLDRDPAEVHYGPVYTLIGRDGSPSPLPAGAAGVLPVYKIAENSNRREQKNNTTTWAVVFPTATGLEFSLHVGPPGEAVIAAHSALRYSELSWTSNGWLMAKAVNDGKWRLFRHLTDIPVGQANTDFTAALNNAAAVIDAENNARETALAAATAAKEAERQAQLKRNFEAVRGTSLMCNYRLDATFSQDQFLQYLDVCGPDHDPGFRRQAAAKGISHQQMEDAVVALGLRQMAQARDRSRWEEEARIRRMQNANKDPGASYIPGQWESAIRNGGNAAVDAINKSSDDWLKKRQDDYIADWQRSQRAY
jgi:hypothetical protein